MNVLKTIAIWFYIIYLNILSILKIDFKDWEKNISQPFLLIYRVISGNYEKNNK